MQRKLLKRSSSFLIALTAAATLFLGGCEGDKGDPGAPGRDATSGFTNISSLTTQQRVDLEFDQTNSVVTGVTIASPPVVTFKIIDVNGNPVRGIGQRSANGQLTNLAFSIAKLVPGTDGSPSTWVNYVVTSSPTGTTPVAASRPTRDREGTLVENSDGSYTYTFARDIAQAQTLANGFTYAGNNRRADLGDLTYNPSLTHRVVVEYGGEIPDTEPELTMKNAVNIIYDFIPATGARVTSANSQREIVLTKYCNECHGNPGDPNNLSDQGWGLGITTPHHDARRDTRYCVICHTFQRAYGRPISTAVNDVYTDARTYVTAQTGANGEVLGEFVTLVHKIHMGDRLTKSGYNYAGVMFDQLVSPTDPALCRKCHRGDTAEQLAAAPQGDNWHDMPSRKACGSCHDGVNFQTGEGHSLGNLVQTNDSACTGCHNATGVQQNHQSRRLTTTNTTTPAGYVNFFYEIASATVDAATNNLSVRFRIQQSTDSAANKTNVVFTGPGAVTGTPADAVISGFSGSPSFLLAYALPQDGIDNPADYNNRGKVAAQPDLISIANLLAPANAGTLGSISGPDASGYYTATILSARAFPAGATMRAVGLQAYFTQSNVTENAGRYAVSVITPVTGDAVRRKVVDSSKCDVCHERLDFHGGNRVFEIQLCITCHNPNLTSSGRTITANLSTFAFTPVQQAILTEWEFDTTLTNAALNFPETSNNLKDMIHGIHAGQERSTPFRDVRNGPGAGRITLINAGSIAFPNLLGNCEACHVTDPANTNRVTYDVELPAGVLPTTNVTQNNIDPAARTAAGITAARGTVPNPQDLVIAPTTGACISCHDTPIAKAHMQANGALLGAGLNGPSYTDVGVARSVLDAMGPPNFGEQCVLCHGTGRIADVTVVHQR
uniref:Outer membrane cytochrome MtrC/MtrF-like domain-containing protein n=1 Tax=Geobacter sp. (strain M21) TaxID=443144 RepID=C6E1M3_GEOSM